MPSAPRSKPVTPGAAAPAKGRRRRRVLVALLLGLMAVPLLLALLDRAFPPVLERYRDRSTLVLAHDGQLLRAFLAKDGRWRLAAEADALPQRYRSMLLGFEDRRFYSHPGVDPLALLRAVGQVASNGRVVSGASTLSMQTARLLEPRPRTLSAKLVEMLRALQLEWHYDKAQILDIYLTLVPMGGNLEGVRAGSLAWFGKEPAALTDAEAALLVALPQAPSRLQPDRFPAAAEAGRRKVLERMAGQGLLSAEALAEALAEPLPTRRHDFPSLAPHLTARLHGEHPGAEVIRTTLDAAAQRAAESLLDDALAQRRDAVTAAALAVEAETGAVRAYVGNAAWLDPARLGGNDMVRAIRSPGSTLKPFIYGLAFTDLVAQPETILADLPQRYGSYAPRNFSGGFGGELTAAEALRQSLNLPAVALLNEIGPGRLADALAQAGVPLVYDRRQARPSLPMALGGVGFSLERLVGAYTALTRGGAVQPLHVLADSPATSARPLLGAVPAWQVARILEQAPRPEGFARAGVESAQRRAGFKTGTSYGFRDAWAVGFAGGWTAGIWVGRADGNPCDGCLGLGAAAPLLLRLFDRLPTRDWPAESRSPPADLPAATRGNAGLPPGLRRFAPRAEVSDTAGIARADALQIRFPPEGAAIPLRHKELPLKVQGGRRPFTWFVDGRPLDSGPSWRQQQPWTPGGPGAVELLVVDADGRSATARFRLTDPTDPGTARRSTEPQLQRSDAPAP